MTAEERFRARLPDDVVLVAEAEPACHGPLAPGEEEAIAGASPKRKREFAIGRDCARRALAKLGVEPCAIPVGALREPVWPEGVTGSIAHCTSCWAAAVTHRSAYRAIGIDTEVYRPLPPRVRNMVINKGEDSSQSIPSNLDHWDVVIFSAKEAIFKAWSPAQRCWLGFADARVQLQPEHRTFEAHVAHPDPGPFQVVRGVFEVYEGVVFTAALVP